MGRIAARVAAFGSLAVFATGCRVPIFGYPTHIASVQGHRIEDFWKWTCVAAIAVGIFMVALILYAPFAYRKRDDQMPRQVRYNLPVEILYTVVPFVVVAGLFYFTARDENYLDKTTPHAQLVAEQGIVVDVTGFQWNWKFTYPDYAPDPALIAAGKDNGDRVQSVGTPQALAHLVLPAGRKVQFVEDSEDVIHSFWIPAFVFKRDVLPGRENVFELTPDRPGEYVGRCAELCGVFHDRMNFQVTVLKKEDWDAWMAQQQGTTSPQVIPVKAGS